MPELTDWKLAELLAKNGISISKENAERFRREFNTNGTISGTGISEKVQAAIDDKPTIDTSDILLGILDYDD